MDAKQGQGECPRCRELEGRIAELEALVRQLSVSVKQLLARNQELTAALEEAQRAAKRQAAPFSKGPPRTKPKKPGRKKGRRHGTHGHLRPPPPERIDEVHQATLPEVCPRCGGRHIEHTDDTVQHQVEIPRRAIWRRFEIELGRCGDCGRSVQGQHELQTSHAVGAAGVALGAEAQGAAVYLNKKCGLSHGRVAWVFRELFGITLSRGGVAQLLARMAKKCRPLYQQIGASVRASPRVRLDETGWRIGGRLGWLHALVGDASTCYVICRSRGADAAAGIIGWDYKGTLLRDGWSAYDQFLAAQQAQCVQHVVRRARGLLEVARGAAAHFPRQVLRVFRDALRCRARLERRGAVADSPARVRWYHHFTDRLAALLRHPKTHAANARFLKHLVHYLVNWFTFLLDPQLEAANWPAEQAVRYAVVNRKVWGGNRTSRGATTQQIILSVLETCRRTGQNTLDFLAQLLHGHTPTLVPSPA